MKNSRQQITDLAELFIRTKGYHAFSYADIAEELNLKNAAIHYYFPSKTDLGLEVIQQTLQAFRNFTELTREMPEDKQLKKYCDIFKTSQKKGWVCLMGALSSCYDSLPDQMQQELTGMTKEMLHWLTQCLHTGRQKGIFAFDETAQTKANLIQSSFLAGLLMNKVAGEKVSNSIYAAVIKAV